MDAKDLELYEEEKRLANKELNANIVNLTTAFDELRKFLETQPETTQVKGSVEISNPTEEVEVSNLDILQESFSELGDQLKEAIENSKVEPVTELSVKNIKDAKTDAVKITNLKELAKSFEEIKKAIEALNLEVNVEKQDVNFPNGAKKYVSVRLTDGKAFYKAMGGLSQALHSLPTVVSTVTGELVLAVANADGSAISGGAAVSSVYDTGVYGTATYA